MKHFFQLILLVAICMSSSSCNGSLNVIIEGAGTVFYKGAPQITSAISGVGSLVDAN